MTVGIRERQTFLFTDMRGFGAAVEELADDAAIEVLDAYRTMIEEAASHWGGRVLGFIGDGSLITFEHAADAVYCAYEIQRAQARVAESGGPNFPLAVGIHTGAALRWRGDYVGQAVNRAARLEWRARGGEILISGEVRAAIRAEEPADGGDARGGISYVEVAELAPEFEGVCRVSGPGMPAPGEPPHRLPAGLPMDRDRLLELLFALQDALRAQRRAQTFLSVDVVDSTGMKVGEDELAIEYSFRQYHRYVADVVREQGGRVHCVSGDGVMAAFDGPEPAARAARKLQEGLALLNGEGNRLRRPFRLRCGINGGVVPALAPEDATGLFSQVLDIAANLQEQAAPGEIWISAASADGARRALGELREVPDGSDGGPAYVWPAR
jgi:class 3 adenylate cyclase